MKILIITDDYLPKSKKVSAKMLHELACEFHKLGHQVCCVTPNNYSDSAHEVINEIEVFRFKTGAVKNTGKLKRLINELRFSNKVWKLVNKNNLKPDAIVYYSPSIFFGKAVIKLKKHFSIPSYLVLRDFFPQWTIDHGIIKQQSLIAKFLRYYECINYQAASHIGVMSPANLSWFNSYTDKRYIKNCSVLYNWVDIDSLDSIAPNVEFRQKYALEDKVIFIYGGNIGFAQNMQNVVNLAHKMQSYGQAQFVLIGQGDEYQLVANAIKKFELNNILLLPGVSQKEYFSIQKIADVGLFSLHKDHKAHNFPGKILGYISQPLPVLGSVNSGNDLMELINKRNAGLVSLTGDDSVLYANAVKLLDKRCRQEYAMNAKRLAKSVFSVESAAERILDVFVGKKSEN
ncbi:glycosyltransferase family 4 protein [Cysteiniphilum halobium]|uniref:glycosyltransferase family 4 protein n=1 Tax=Cysteiniphilum halobium TaxID=2219059 RepID=UPI003F836A99